MKKLYVYQRIIAFIKGMRFLLRQFLDQRSSVPSNVVHGCWNVALSAGFCGFAESFPRDMTIYLELHTSDKPYGKAREQVN